MITMSSTTWRLSWISFSSYSSESNSFLLFPRGVFDFFSLIHPFTTVRCAAGTCDLVLIVFYIKFVIIGQLFAT